MLLNITGFLSQIQQSLGLPFQVCDPLPVLVHSEVGELLLLFNLHPVSHLLAVGLLDPRKQLFIPFVVVLEVLLPDLEELELDLGLSLLDVLSEHFFLLS